ncbi:MAG TPA: hypothetical protein VFS05_01570 [Gemmatimonadaceae bacterium]|nr:hypothetical protein [Gemmatimonadaceae bacterium]
MFDGNVDEWTLWTAMGVSFFFAKTPVIGAVSATIDGQEQRYRAVVVEQVLILEHPDDRYPCALTHRTLYATDSAGMALYVEGADFSLPVRRHSLCQPWPGAYRPPRHPAVVLGRVRTSFSASARRSALDGIDGLADIAPLPGDAGPCTFVAREEEVVPEIGRTECEALRFLVTADVRMEARDAAADAPGRPVRLELRPQAVPGIRIRRYCGTTEPAELYEVNRGCRRPPDPPGNE